MIILNLLSGRIIRLEPSRHSFKQFPRVQLRNIEYVTVRDTDLIILSKIITGIPMPGRLHIDKTREFHYPGDIGILVYLNLKDWYKSENAQNPKAWTRL